MLYFRSADHTPARPASPPSRSFFSLLRLSFVLSLNTLFLSRAYSSPSPSVFFSSLVSLSSMPSSFSSGLPACSLFFSSPFIPLLALASSLPSFSFPSRHFFFLTLTSYLPSLAFFFAFYLTLFSSPLSLPSFLPLASSLFLSPFSSLLPLPSFLSPSPHPCLFPPSSPLPRLSPRSVPSPLSNFVLLILTFILLYPSASLFHIPSFLPSSPSP